MNTLVIVIIILVIIVLCLRNVMNRVLTVHAVPEYLAPGGAATAMLTDPLKAALIYGLASDMCVMIPNGSLAWKPNPVYNRQLEVYCWKTKNQYFAKCGVLCEKLKNNKYNPMAEAESRLENAEHDMLIHIPLIYEPSDTTLPGLCIGAALTLYEQLGHAMIWSLLTVLRPSEDVTAVSHTQLSDWPFCMAGSGAECFTHVHANAELSSDLLIGAICNTAIGLCALSGNILVIKTHTVADSYKDLNLNVLSTKWQETACKNEEYNVRMRIIQSFAVSAQHLLMNLCKRAHDQDTTLCNYSAEDLAEEWVEQRRKLMDQMTADGNNIPEEITHTNTELNFNNNGAVNIFDVPMCDPEFVPTTLAHVNVVYKAYNKDPTAMQPDLAYCATVLQALLDGALPAYKNGDTRTRVQVAFSDLLTRAVVSDTNGARKLFLAELAKYLQLISLTFKQIRSTTKGTKLSTESKLSKSYKRTIAQLKRIADEIRISAVQTNNRELTSMSDALLALTAP